MTSSLDTEKDGGTLWTWGSGGDGRLGHGDTSDRLVPATVEALQVFHNPLFHLMTTSLNQGCCLKREPLYRILREATTIQE